MGEVRTLPIDRNSEIVFPFSTEAEQQVLGAILLDPDRMAIVGAHGGTDLFHDPVHADIYRYASQVHRDGLLVSPVTLSQWAAGHEGIQELGGARYIARLAGWAIAPSQVAHYVEHLSDLSLRRQILRAVDDARRAISMGDEQTGAIASRLVSAMSVLGETVTARPISMMEAVTQALDSALAAQRGDPDGFVPTGIKALDRIIHGFNPGDLILLGGRPGMGKTSVALNVALNAGRAGRKVGFVSLEMLPEGIAARALSEASAEFGQGVNYDRIRAGELPSRIDEIARAVAGLPIVMLPRQYADVGALLAGVQSIMARLDGLDLLIVDYVQLMRTAGKANRYETITEISQALKSLAMRLKIPIVALSQLSRAVETRDDKRPMLSDLRESGQLEQDADMVIFCYRDAYYLDRERPDDGDMDAFADWQAAMSRKEHDLELIVAKQRMGATGTAKVLCNVAMNRIWEPEWRT